MARYTGPNNKKARRVSFSILENGKDIAKRPYGPGQHGKDRKRKPSNYAIQLNEKQKARFMYGISEKQFKKLVNDSAKMKGVHGENLLRRGARQLVNHGHITVNGKKVDIPSYRVKPGDVIAIKENSSDHKGIEIALANKVKRPDFINYDESKRIGTYVRYPERSELNADINESLIVEIYSRV